VMGDVELVILCLVIWTPILALAELVVSATILIAMPPDCGRYGGRVAKVTIISIRRVRVI
jgi:hypothetical protein